MHEKNIKTSGKEISEAKKALVMIHGRGGNAEDILSLRDHLNVKNYALFAPQATGNTWYPYSFLAKREQNEPGLSSALQMLKELLQEIESKGFSSENIYFLGFSQGACLTLEFVTLNAKRYGGVVAFTGGLIGDRIYNDKYNGDFGGTPIFIGTGNPDPHVPVERVEKSAGILEEMNASVTVKVYDNRPHTISMEEIEIANELIFK
ncbi:dienelactone hydrolase family protein [Antarcticibacterium sp. 1MA-6-2]|uniref:alpha/beta hydrolase n=1 Tax=Antarcticibacterium sp. 1MA-6-2 TaxID=2908210 RepID=UPI001F2DB4A2|nr:dienelactone hydrolase family protein [Antarcticibacterium sp. 1MA-6-2]UJH91211.1 dienelactone hydrolase family protein [Antarcticibacterium sp. 1MA-6-2]